MISYAFSGDTRIRFYSGVISYAFSGGTRIRFYSGVISYAFSGVCVNNLKLRSSQNIRVRTLVSALTGVIKQ